MTIEQIKVKIAELAQKHKEAPEEDEWLWESLELEAYELIFNYAIDKHINFGGFPIKEALEGKLEEIGDIRSPFEVYTELHLQISDNKDVLLNTNMEFTELLNYFEKQFWN